MNTASNQFDSLIKSRASLVVDISKHHENAIISLQRPGDRFGYTIEMKPGEPACAPDHLLVMVVENCQVIGTAEFTEDQYDHFRESNIRAFQRLHL